MIDLDPGGKMLPSGGHIWSISWRKGLPTGSDRSVSYGLWGEPSSSPWAVAQMVCPASFLLVVYNLSETDFPARDEEPGGSQPLESPLAVELDIDFAAAWGTHQTLDTIPPISKQEDQRLLHEE